LGKRKRAAEFESGGHILQTELGESGKGRSDKEGSNGYYSDSGRERRKKSAQVKTRRDGFTNEKRRAVLTPLLGLRRREGKSGSGKE